MTARCINDQVSERYGFLWLKTRMVKDPRITKDREYDVEKLVVSQHGGDGWVLIECDLGYPQLIEASRMKVTWKDLNELIEKAFF